MKLVSELVNCAECCQKIAVLHYCVVQFRSYLTWRVLDSVWDEVVLEIERHKRALDMGRPGLAGSLQPRQPVFPPPYWLLP